ncbi:MAG: hypothetical protein HEQ20_22305 [Aphanizomenon flos-aquae KM1D3_PB]|nr:hypothetical protein [Aphanizomenon flos-aquae]QSV69397.1 MAG: hypothetical protein HEQ20_22305 [Aphanizomenon flos-aquae KM1D3_PB]
MSLWQGKSEEVLGDFTFLYTFCFFSAHLLMFHNCFRKSIKAKITEL